MFVCQNALAVLESLYYQFIIVMYM
uniref:Uncharacterized protein n=1 Tax=Arundo donax TaxID=35708 RepID=A0A0A9FTG7_ARUDO